MGIFDKIKDNFKSSEFSVASNSKVKTLKRNFEKVLMELVRVIMEQHFLMKSYYC